MSRAIFERLRMSEHGIAQMARSVREVASLADPLGRQLAVTELDDGLTLYKESCPIGVVGIVFEARPEIIPQIAALALKSGNAVILKGGAEAAHSNQTLVSIWCAIRERVNIWFWKIMRVRPAAFLMCWKTACWMSMTN